MTEQYGAVNNKTLGAESSTCDLRSGGEEFCGRCPRLYDAGSLC